MKRFLAILFIPALALGLTACGGGESASSAPQAASKTAAPAFSSVAAVSEDNLDPYAERTYTLNEHTDQFHISGRTLAVHNELGDVGMMFDQTAQGLVFTADCEGDIVLRLSMKAVSDAEATHYFTLYLDGVRQEERIALTGTENKEVVRDLTLAAGLTRGEHTVALYRQSASIFGPETLLSVTLHGKAAVYDKKPTRIEFVGDSITVGWGDLVDAKSAEKNQGNPKFSDGTQTYAFLAAEEIGAEISTVAVSGSVYLTHEKITSPNIMDYFPYYSRSRKDKIDYDFAANPVDIVVISLGTNDDGWTAFRGNARVEQGVAFLKKIREAYPKAKIVWTYGQMSVSNYDVMEQTVEAAGGKAKGFYFFRYTAPDRNGGGTHPSLEGHARLGHELAAYLEALPQ